MISRFRQASPVALPSLVFAILSAFMAQIPALWRRRSCGIFVVVCCGREERLVSAVVARLPSIRMAH